jgi:hypothetical protein
MVGEADVGLLSDVSLNTVLLNILNMVENRLKTLDVASKKITADSFDFNNALSVAIRSTGDIQASKEVSDAIRQLNLFYLKYRNSNGNIFIKKLEARYITNLKNALVNAGIKTMANMDQTSLGLLRDTMEKRGIINTGYSIDLTAFQKFKKKLFGDKK